MTVETTGPVALICGGTAGIGLAIARALLEAGTRRLMVVGRTETRGQDALAQLRALGLPADIRFMAGDMAKPEAATRVADGCVEAFGRIDTLVSGAAGEPMARLLHEIPIEQVPGIIGSITSGILLPLRATLPHMMRQGSGSMICIASDAAKVATIGETAIGAAMAAVAMFCRGLAMEAKRSGIRVNCITPSIVQDTPLYSVVMADPFASKIFTKAERLARLGVVQPHDLAALAVFLASPAAARLTGQTISVNGGISAA